MRNERVNREMVLDHSIRDHECAFAGEGFRQAETGAGSQGLPDYRPADRVAVRQRRLGWQSETDGDLSALDGEAQVVQHGIGCGDAGQGMRTRPSSCPAGDRPANRRS